jgi:hypothetical protein
MLIYLLRVSYVIPDDSILNSKAIQVDKLEIDDLFGRVEFIPFDPFADVQEKKEEKVEIKEEKKNFIETTINLEEMFNSLDELNMNSIQMETKKKWFIIIPSLNNIGPYTGREILSYLTQILKVKDEISKRASQSFMVCDSEMDIYFQPEAALELLEKEIPQAQSNTIFRQHNYSQNFPSINSLSSMTHLSNLKERKFPGYFNMVSKFDQLENNPYVSIQQNQNLFKHPRQQLDYLTDHKEIDNFNLENCHLNVREKTNENSRNKFDIGNHGIKENESIYDIKYK